LNRTDQLPSDGYRVVNQRNPVTTPEHPPIPRDRASRGLDENFAAMSLQRGEAEQTSVTRAFQTKGPLIPRTIRIAHYSNRGHCLGQTLADILFLNASGDWRGQPTANHTVLVSMG
jgi:hypothetical protein